MVRHYKQGLRGTWCMMWLGAWHVVHGTWFGRAGAACVARLISRQFCWMKCPTLAATCLWSQPGVASWSQPGASHTCKERGEIRRHARQMVTRELVLPQGGHEGGAIQQLSPDSRACPATFIRPSPCRATFIRPSTVEQCRRLCAKLSSIRFWVKLPRPRVRVSWGMAGVESIGHECTVRVK